MQATGAGAFGVQSGMLEGDTNILIYVILSEARLVNVLDDLEALMKRGHRLKAIVSDITILPRKDRARSSGSPGRLRRIVADLAVHRQTSMERCEQLIIHERPDCL
ncbi:MAG: hypothetical protein MZV65_30785 [Chromatiales bacterium]|nr:hypothetical protein [Chromatiales bacterium]